MVAVDVALGERAYAVRIGRNLLVRAAEWSGPPLRAGVLRDDGVPFSWVDRVERGLQGAGFSLAKVTVRAGEASKCLSEAERILDALAAAGLERSSPLFVVGGGMAGDLGGFCASVLFRGVPLVLIPTTLLAQLDAAVGGKNGVNLARAKNLVGTFWQPRVVLCDLDALSTLPLRELRNGLAEAVKCALLGDPELLALLEADPGAAQAGAPDLLASVVERAVRVKAAIVARDERETGQRRLLNFGHTVGHALESASAFDLRHGEAVSLGMVAALRVGVGLGATPPDLASRAVRLLEALGLPVDLDPYVAGPWFSPVALDKKRNQGLVRFVVLSAPGRADVVEMTPADLAANLRF
jgi:3-dehydroquinate synthase